MPGGVRRKWRPPLALVIGGTLAAVMALPIVGLTWFRLAGNILGWLETAQLFGAVSLVVTLVLALLLWRLVLRPVWALTKHARAMKAGRADAKPPSRFGTSELSNLGRSVIEMGDALNARARSLTAYADHVTHELKSPLTSLQGAAEMLADPSLDAEDRARLLATIQTSSTRMEQLLNDLRDHAAARWDSAAGHCRLIDAVAGLEPLPGLEVRRSGDAPLPMSAHDATRVLVQMARNAAEHGASMLEIRAVEGGFSVLDNGRGVAEGDKARIFDPFFTTTRESGGTGMGLAIVRTLVEAAGGRIKLAPSPQGARFEILF